MFGDNENLSDSEDDDYIPTQEDLKLIAEPEIILRNKTITLQTKQLFKSMQSNDHKIFTDNYVRYKEVRDLTPTNLQKRMFEVVNSVIDGNADDGPDGGKLLHFAGKVYKLNKENELEEVKEDRHKLKKLIDKATR